jgi:hypothetical protein
MEKKIPKKLAGIPGQFRAFKARPQSRTALPEGDRRETKDDHHGERGSHTCTLIDRFVKHGIPPKV